MAPIRFCLYVDILMMILSSGVLRGAVPLFAEVLVGHQAWPLTFIPLYFQAPTLAALPARETTPARIPAPCLSLPSLLPPPSLPLLQVTPSATFWSFLPKCFLFRPKEIYIFPVQHRQLEQFRQCSRRPGPSCPS